MTVSNDPIDVFVFFIDLYGRKVTYEIKKLMKDLDCPRDAIVFRINSAIERGYITVSYPEYTDKATFVITESGHQVATKIYDEIFRSHAITKETRIRSHARRPHL